MEISNVAADTGMEDTMAGITSIHHDDDDEQDLEWEEWDGRSPFLHHCIAGSIAGVAEHTLLYPVDTIKTHMQSYCASCPNNPQQGNHSSSTLGNSSSLRGAMAGNSNHGMWRTMRNLVLHGTGSNGHLSVSRPATNLAVQPSMLELSAMTAAASPSAVMKTSYLRLWRGVQTMAVGCVPAHALYFSSYEAVKALFLKDKDGRDATHLSPLGSSVAGATATVCHDLIMSPLDTIKQRLQLGHYGGMAHGIRHVLANEGYSGLYRSFPVTLLTNVPYGMIMVSTNEFLKHLIKPDDDAFDLTTSLTAGCGAGFVAAALTTPLDRVKTRLQTQSMGSGTYGMESVSAPCASRGECGGKLRQARLLATTGNVSQQQVAKYEGFNHALKSIVREEGAIGLCRGMMPRILMHSPAVAISWTAYEGAKKWLLQ